MRLSQDARQSGLDKLAQDVLAGRLDTRIALECFLLVKLGLRRLAVVNIPAELPDGDVLGAQVDYEFRNRLAGRSSLKTRMSDTVASRKMPPLAFKAHILRSCFQNNVAASDSYRAYREAAESIGLEIIEWEVRPTMREWHIFKPEDREAVAALLKRRAEIQKEKRREFKPGQDSVSYYVYPEKRDPEFVRALGRLLGYPECCMDEYAEGHVKDELPTPICRAARQIEETAGGKAGEAGGGFEAFWVKDFFPCRPDCREAVSRGSQAREALSRLDPRLGELYDELRRRHLERVASAPRDLAEHEKYISRRT